ncbi:hypothetical protein [Nocardia fluminea]|uniref:hypothetical protein n=1 Tax=Nocardia fluminea TaxID=134984 RepID=UPI00344A77A1
MDLGDRVLSPALRAETIGTRLKLRLLRVLRPVPAAWLAMSVPTEQVAAARRGVPEWFSRSFLNPLTGVGIQLCPCNIAMCKTGAHVYTAAGGMVDRRRSGLLSIAWVHRRQDHLAPWTFYRVLAVRA